MCWERAQVLCLEYILGIAELKVEIVGRLPKKGRFWELDKLLEMGR